MQSLAKGILSFNNNLKFTGKLPKGIGIMNPFQSEEVKRVTGLFYNKYYNDTRPRYMILGINPGRHGAGVTGIPFSDTKRLTEFCGITMQGLHSHELSSVFIYDMIMAYGGVKKFYNKFYINSICPLGFVSINDNGRHKNYNYYDSPELTGAAKGFIVSAINNQLSLGFRRDKCWCLGTGKNFKHLLALNEEHKFFGEIIPLDHPRFIMQYRLKKKDEYIAKYLSLLK
jgi:hypothetical protein